jgi:hypothetical protein
MYCAHDRRALALPRRGLPWANYRTFLSPLISACLCLMNSISEYTCLTSVGSAQNARNGYTVLRVSRPSSFARRSASTTRCCWRRNRRYRPSNFHPNSIIDADVFRRTEWQNLLCCSNLLSTHGGSYGHL